MTDRLLPTLLAFEQLTRLEIQRHITITLLPKLGPQELLKEVVIPEPVSTIALQPGDEKVLVLHQGQHLSRVGYAQQLIAQGGVHTW